MKRVHENTQLVDSTSVVEVLSVYTMKFGIIDIVTPADIEKKEYRWMYRLNTLQPVGINVEYPFGIPFLGQR